MLVWFNPSHPQTMQASVILGYFSGVFALLFTGGNLLFIVAAILLLGGAFGCANNKKIGYVALLVGALIMVGLAILVVALALFPSSCAGTGCPSFIGARINPPLRALSGAVFPMALVAAVVHSHTRTYMSAWFE